MTPKVKTISQIPGWTLGATTANKVSTPAGAYEKIPIINTAVGLRSDSLTAVPVYTFKGDEAVDWPFPQDLMSLLWQTEAGMLTAGAGYWLKINDRGGRIKALQWLNPTTMTVKFNGFREDGTFGLLFTQQLDAGQSHTWNETQMVYFREWSLRSDVSPGPSATSVALDASNLHYQMTRFAKEHFEKGVMPVVLLSFEDNPSTEETSRVENWFKRQAMGLTNGIGSVLGLGSKITPTILTPDMDKLAMPELAEYARHQVANAFRIPQSMLDDAANFATASAHNLQFWRNTILPRLRLYEAAINEQLMEPMGLSIRFAPQEMDVFQVDEEVRAGSYSTYVNTQMKPSVAAEMLGLELPSGVEYADLDTDAKEMQESANDTQAQPDNSEKALILNLADTDDLIIEWEPKTDTNQDLKRWQKKARTSLAKGRGATVVFESNYITEGIHEFIAEGLKTASSTEDIKAVFDEAKVKSQTAMRKNIKQAVRGLWSGALTRDHFDDAMFNAVNVHLIQAWNEGAASVGVAEDDLTGEELTARSGFIRKQTAFIQSFADAIIEGNKESGGKLSAFDSRISIWANRYGEAQSLGMLMAKADAKLMWARGATEEGCKTCKGLDGRTYRASVWEKNNARPRSANLACEGHNCKCTLSPTDERVSPGRFPSSLFKQWREAHD